MFECFICYRDYALPSEKYETSHPKAGHFYFDNEKYLAHRHLSDSTLFVLFVIAIAIPTA
jgi:hypothetical protein